MFISEQHCSRGDTSRLRAEAVLARLEGIFRDLKVFGDLVL